MSLENGRSSVYNLGMPKALDFPNIIVKLRKFHREHKRLPVFSEMQSLLGYRSKGGVSTLIPSLVRKRILNQDSSGRLIPGPLMQGGLRFLGSVQAGFPSPAEEELIDTLSLDEFLVKNPTASFLVKASGDSMIDAGIMPGDLVIVERGREPHAGDIVIAQVDGDWTMKYFQKKNGKVILVAGNKKYPPIHAREELVIGGVVVANVRKYK